MAQTDSIVDPRILAKARALLAEPRRRTGGVGAALGAAVFFAVCALGLAVAMVIAPSNVTTPVDLPGS